MKNLRFVMLACGCLFLVGLGSLRAQPSGSAEPALAPYLTINGEEGVSALMPVESGSVVAEVDGVVANVLVRQVFHHQGERPVEAVYVFPGSTSAAVHHMEMIIGNRRIRSVVQEKSQAIATYQAALSEGKTAGLLEQHRANVFRTTVGNIMPGDRIVVELGYTEILLPEEGTYSLVVPTVVGPRFSLTPAATGSPDAAWVSNPYLLEGRSSGIDYRIGVTIRGRTPISDVACPTHAVDVSWADERQCRIDLRADAGVVDDRDFILHYRLASGAVETGVLSGKFGNEQYFLAMIQPPERVPESLVVPREFVFLVDVSGSMSGFPLEVSKQLILDLLNELRPHERFNIVFFAGGREKLAPAPVPATGDNLAAARAMIDRQQGGGGTRLLDGLREAFDQPATEGVSRTIVVLTDGFVDFETEAFDLVESRLGEANLFAFGIGSSVNRLLIEGMARVGRGEPRIVTSAAAAPAAARAFREEITSPVLTDIRLEVLEGEVEEVQPAQIPDLFRSRPILISGRTGPDGARIRISGTTASGQWSSETRVEPSAMDSSAIPLYWARSRIQRLDDYGSFSRTESGRDEILALGLRFNLLTRYTSFVAVDEVIRNSGAPEETLTQVLPLPKGVSNLAVGGGGVPGGPEPRAAGLLLVALAALLFG